MSRMQGRVGPMNQPGMSGNMQPNTMPGPNIAAASMAGGANMNMGMG